MMLEIGSTITAEVCAIERDGVILKDDANRIFVDIGNVTWSRFSKLADVIAVSDQVKVKVVRFNRARGVFEGSIKALRPELNPYIPLAGQPPKRHFRGVIKSVGKGQRTLVEFDSGACGTLDEQSAPEQLRPGEVVEVVITRVDPHADENNLDVSIVEPWKAPNGT